jgi:hypothetical protein
MFGQLERTRSCKQSQLANPAKLTQEHNYHTMPESKDNKPSFPLASQATDGWSTETEATATCYCGAVQLAFVRPVPP